MQIGKFTVNTESKISRYNNKKAKFVPSKTYRKREKVTKIFQRKKLFKNGNNKRQGWKKLRKKGGSSSKPGLKKQRNKRSIFLGFQPGYER